MGKSYNVDNRGEYVSRYATDLINDLVCMKGHVNVERSDYVEFILSMPERAQAVLAGETLETLRNRPKFIHFIGWPDQVAKTLERDAVAAEQDLTSPTLVLANASS
jgi:hypothetical protein